jgi:hypothetical protein
MLTTEDKTLIAREVSDYMFGGFPVNSPIAVEELAELLYSISYVRSCTNCEIH